MIINIYEDSIPLRLTLISIVLLLLLWNMTCKVCDTFL